MNNSSELCRMPVAHVCWSGCDPVADEHYHPPSMKTEVEPRVHDCIVRVCQGCIDLKGQECHVPECVFCFKGMDEAKWLLDKMLICPIIDGERYILAGDAVEAEARATTLSLHYSQSYLRTNRIEQGCSMRCRFAETSFGNLLKEITIQSGWAATKMLVITCPSSLSKQR